MPDNYEDLPRDQLISLLRRRDATRKLGLVWERDEIEHERDLTEDLPLLALDSKLSRGTGPWSNLLIEGDNFHVLRFLTKAYRGQVKCLYLDPPYNTGTKDFIYNDRFLSAEDGWRQSKWLEFLYRRLSLARDLLRQDGVLLVSINDENRAYLELLLEQVWPGGRKGSVVWRSRIGDNSGHGANLSVNHEHILVWANQGFRFRGDDKSYDMYDGEDQGGRFRVSDLTQSKNWLERPNSYYPIHNTETDTWYPPNGDRVWAFASETKLTDGQVTRKDTMEELVRQGRIIFPSKGEFETWNSEDELREALGRDEGPKDGRKTQLIRDSIPLIPLSFWVGKKIGFGIPTFKRYIGDMEDTTQPLSSWTKPKSEKTFEADDGAVHIESGFTDEGSKEVRRLLGDKAFNYPKPPSLMRSLIEQSTSPGDFVMDFFAGSGTTGQAAAELDRRFLLVSSTEANEESPDKNLCRDVAARRLEALGLSFAYLRVERHPLDEAGRDVSEEVVWASIQQLSAGTVGLFVSERTVQVTETETQLVLLVRKVTPDVLTFLNSLVVPPGKTAVVYCWQPGPVRQALAHRTDARVEALPQALVTPLIGGLA